MVFSNPTTEDGLIQEMDRICVSNDTSYPLKAKTARLNQALDRYVVLAQLYEGGWQWDDTNQTTFPIGTQDIVSGQQDYTFASDVLGVSKVLIADNTGIWRELQLLDQEDSTSRNIWQLPTGNTGVPRRYDIFANSVLLDPIPNYSRSAGLKVVFRRGASKFVSGDTTKEPGIPSLFHLYLARYASLPYLVEKKIPYAHDVKQLIDEDEAAIIDFMSDRSKHKKTKIFTNWRSSK